MLSVFCWLAGIYYGLLGLFYLAWLVICWSIYDKVVRWRVVGFYFLLCLLPIVGALLWFALVYSDMSMYLNNQEHAYVSERSSGTRQQ